MNSYLIANWHRFCNSLDGVSHFFVISSYQLKVLLPINGGGELKLTSIATKERNCRIIEPHSHVGGCDLKLLPSYELLI